MNKEKIDDYFKNRTPEELEYIFSTYKPKRKKKDVEEVNEEGWVDYKKEIPTELKYYQTKVKGTKDIISDWWNNRGFTFNDSLVTHWKRK